jgi:pyruvate dehydrogenase E1 component alpha subunit
MGRELTREAAMLRILNEEGKVRPGAESGLGKDDVRKMYRLMVLTRTADAKALKLQRQGRMGTYASSAGHEACQIGTAFPLRPEDCFFPYFRDMGIYLTLGYPLAVYYHYWMGSEAGLRTPDGLNIFPLAIPVASQIPQSVGAALAGQLLKRTNAVVCTFGDGATSEGDFHEGLNFAGVFRTPNVFVCYDNQWAISTPRSRQTASATISQKADAYGFPGVQVDGNDVLAVHAAVSQALDRARAGEGPTLIEAVTYRMGHHTTSDDATRYRPEDDLKTWEPRDPLRRFQLYLRDQGWWDEAFENDAQSAAAEAVETAVTEAESRPSAAPEDIFAFTYKVMPPVLGEQLAELKRDLAGEAGR